MRQARALVFPSIYEGFGIPPLEAMSQNCPVLASAASAVREVCGPAAEYFNYSDDAALARLMEQALVGGESWRTARITAGAERVRLFSWRRSAEALAQSCAELA
jgi:glycosyltransferase involved in cell wall biosynthesis